MKDDFLSIYDPTYNLETSNNGYHKVSCVFKDDLLISIHNTFESARDYIIKRYSEKYFNKFKIESWEVRE